MNLPDLEKCHLLRLSIPDLLLGSILDPPKGAQEGSRSSLRSMFTFSACLKIIQKWTSKWTFLRSKVSTTSLLGASRINLGNDFCTSELRLENMSRNYQHYCRFGDLGARVPTIENPWHLHGISIDSTASRTPYI